MDAPSPTPLEGPGDAGSLSATDFASAVTAITSAFGDPTRRDIYLYLREQSDGATAADIAQRFALHSNVARHHLDKLAGGGYVEATVARQTGAGAGRPSKWYRTTNDGNPIDFAVRHDDLLVTLLGKALALLPAEAAAQMAEEVGIEYGRSLAATMGSQDQAQRSFRSSLHVVADALTAHGFAAHAEKQGDELRIVAQHCPFGDTAIEHPVICAVDRGLVKGMLSALYGETRPATESTVALGSETCVTVVTSGTA